MQDIVERLRGSTHQIDYDAADEIERLREGLKIASAAVENLEHEVAAQRKAANEHRNAAMGADLRTLAKAVLDTRSAEAKAAMAAENAQANFHRYEAEYRAHEKAMVAASEAEMALRDALATPNV